MEQTVKAIDAQQRTFLSRRKLAKEGTTNPPQYYTEQDFLIGSVHFICGRYFEIYNCDEHVINFAMSQPGLYTPDQIEQFKQAVGKNSHPTTFDDVTDSSDAEYEVKNASAKLHRWYRINPKRIYGLFVERDPGRSGILTAKMLEEICFELGIVCDDSTVHGLMRKANKGEDVLAMEFTRFLHGINMLCRPVRPRQ